LTKQIEAMPDAQGGLEFSSFPAPTRRLIIAVMEMSEQIVEATTNYLIERGVITCYVNHRTMIEETLALTQEIGAEQSKIAADRSQSMDERLEAASIVAECDQLVAGCEGDLAAQDDLVKAQSIVADYAAGRRA
jgi:hypothetical protein